MLQKWWGFSYGPWEKQDDCEIDDGEMDDDRHRADCTVNTDNVDHNDVDERHLERDDALDLRGDSLSITDALDLKDDSLSITGALIKDPDSSADLWLDSAPDPETDLTLL